MERFVGATEKVTPRHYNVISGVSLGRFSLLDSINGEMRRPKTSGNTIRWRDGQRPPKPLAFFVYPFSLP